MEKNSDFNGELSISDMKKWIVEDKNTDGELGRLLREYFWKNVDKKEL